MVGIDFTGKIALVTGGGGGIPGGVARRYADAGAKVYLTDVSPEKLEAAAAKMRADGLEVITEKMDVTDEAEVIGVIDGIVQKEGRLDILLNGAGILYAKPYMETTREEFERTLDINLVGMHTCTQAALKHMIPRRYGKIVNICSASTRMGSPIIAHYSSSKFGTMGLTQSVALAVAEHSINVNGICPGLVRTDIFDILYADRAKKAGKTMDEYAEVVAQGIPMKRLQSAEDIGNAALFLASDLAFNISGQCLNVCGAMRMN
ncbi:MAG: SDR family oxidoreductase [Ruminococcaceae bacterium]|nr:SDR family oxidoreductase [Oscillospiraceae bacterium]